MFIHFLFKTKGVHSVLEEYFGGRRGLYINLEAEKTLGWMERISWRFMDKNGHPLSPREREGSGEMQLFPEANSFTSEIKSMILPCV